MGYLIRSVDGRTVIGLRDVEAAAKIALHLETTGTAVEISDFNGERYTRSELQRQVSIARQARAASRTIQ